VLVRESFSLLVCEAKPFHHWEFIAHHYTTTARGLSRTFTIVGVDGFHVVFTFVFRVFMLINYTLCIKMTTRRFIGRPLPDQILGQRRLLSSAARVTVERLDSGLAVVTLNRPSKMNALDMGM